MKLSALSALGIYLIWQVINTGIQVSAIGPNGIDLIDLVRLGIAPSLAKKGLRVRRGRLVG